MNVVEAWGSGIPKMFREAEEYGLAEPELIDMGSDFRVNLYRKAAVVDQNGVIDPKGHDTKNETNDTKNETNDTKNETLLLKLIQEDPTITQKELKEKMQISLITVKRIMNELQNKGRIQRIGSNRSGKLSILDQKKSSQ